MENWRKYLNEQNSKLGSKNQYVDVDSNSQLGNEVEDEVVQLVKTAYQKNNYSSRHSRQSKKTPYLARQKT